MDSILVFCLVILTILSIPLISKWKILSMKGIDLPQEQGVKFLSLCLVFILYILLLGIAPQLIIKFLYSEQTQKLHSFSPESIECIAQIVALFSTAIVLIIFSLIVSEKRYIWGEYKFQENIVFLLKGCLISILLYPLVMVIVESAYMITDLIGKYPRGEQVIVQKLKSMRDSPVIFWSMITLSFTLVPIAEEILFRGFLQNFFFKIFGKSLAIIFTSIIFAFFHYSKMQGATNIDLFAGLFFFSYAMGVTYFKTKSLFSSIGMHSAFNMISLIIFIFFANTIK